MDASAPLSDTPATPMGLCEDCKVAPAEPGYFLQFCTACRNKRCHRELPSWIWIMMATASLAFLFSINLAPKALLADIAYERGRRAELAGQYDLAAANYELVLKRYPQSTKAICRVGMAYYQAGEFPAAMGQFVKLADRKLDAKTLKEIEAAIQIMTGKKQK